MKLYGNMETLSLQMEKVGNIENYEKYEEDI